jgi:intein-encoded DNA endonuclease-like protein
LKNYQYLKNGFLEAHLLGLFADQEKEEVTQLLATDNDLLDHLDDLEVEMEEYFLNHAVPPPPGIREKIELRISQTEIEKWVQPNHTEQSRKSTETAPKEPQYVNVEFDDTHIRVHKQWKTALIAIFILSKVFLILGLYYYFKADSLQQEVTRLKAETQVQQTISPRR